MPAVAEARTRVCDLGLLRESYATPDGKIGYRCSAEPVANYVAKGGKVEETVGRKCLCNALMANIGHAADAQGRLRGAAAGHRGRRSEYRRAVPGSRPHILQRRRRGSVAA